MNLKLICLIIILIPAMVYAGTNTGCAGDQWDNHADAEDDANQAASKSQWVYHTNKLWEIGFGGYGSGEIGPDPSGCSSGIGARNNSNSEVSMKNGTCTYNFKAPSAKLTIKNASGAKCVCKGDYILRKKCSAGEGGF